MEIFNLFTTDYHSQLAIIVLVFPNFAQRLQVLTILKGNNMTNFTKMIAIMALTLTSLHAQANECELTITANDAMQFDKKTLSVPATCKEVTLNLKHSGNLPKTAMGHNWVLSTAENIQAIANDGMTAGIEHSYVKPDDTRVIAHTGVIGGGGATSITFSIEGLDSSAAYRFFCSFPGHWAIMQGSFVIEA